MDGILLVDKPQGWTSHDVVAKVRSLLKQQTGQKIKVGHTGTLDPLATGLLVILIGDYCKRAQEFSKLDKTYEVNMKLGEISSTGDEEGFKTAVSSKQPIVSKVKRALGGFIGEIKQTPPAYSAIKINGKRAYQLARAGQEVKLEPRSVTIYDIKLTTYAYPVVHFMTKVSSGTYIRSLVEDIGSRLGTGAYMSNLRRTHVGPFDIKQSYPIDELTHNNLLHNLLTKYPTSKTLKN